MYKVQWDQIISSRFNDLDVKPRIQHHYNTKFADTPLSPPMERMVLYLRKIWDKVRKDCTVKLRKHFRVCRSTLK